jgi:hypothetical protein
MSGDMPILLLFKSSIHLNLDTYDYTKNHLAMYAIQNTTTLVFPTNWNSTIDWVPEGPSVINISSNSFNQSLTNVPNSVKKLVIGNKYGVIHGKFNQPLDYLGSNVEELIIYSKVFNQDLCNLPVNLKKLVIFSPAFQGTFNNLSDSIEEIVLFNFDFKNTIKIPANLKKLILIHIEGKCNFALVYKEFQERFPNIEITTKFSEEYF